MEREKTINGDVNKIEVYVESRGPTPAVNGPVISFRYRKLSLSHSEKKQQSAKSAGHRAIWIVPTVVFVVAVILLGVVSYAADWDRLGRTNRVSTTSSNKESNTGKLAATTGSANNITKTSPTTTTTDASNDTTDGLQDTSATITTTEDIAIGTETPTTTRILADTTVELSTTSGTVGETSTSTTESVSTATNTGSVSTSTTTATTTTTEDVSTTSTMSPTTTTPGTFVAYSLQLTLDEEFPAELLDSNGLAYHQKSTSLCNNVSALFTHKKMGYQGCLVTEIASGSIKISFTMVLRESTSWPVLVNPPPNTNLTEYQNTVVDMLNGHNGLTGNVTLADTCSLCNTVAAAVTKIQASSINECNGVNECSANSSCADGQGTYFCECDPGYYGKYCNNTMDSCKKTACNGHGECWEKLNEQYIFCKCDDGYTGTDCAKVEEIANRACPCSNFTNPCNGRGDCINISQSLYRCVCNSGYNGTDCEENINECTSLPCFHGNCTDEINEYMCGCEEGYTGAQCQNGKDNCDSNVCPVNGTCVDSGSNYTCACDTGYTGEDCHSICDDEPCFNNATCSLCPGGESNGTGLSFECNCTGDGTYGVLCTDRDGQWNEWSEWVNTWQWSIIYIYGTNYSAMNCTYLNTTRYRRCIEPLPLKNGKECHGDSDTSTLSRIECTCTRCCKDTISCYAHLDGIVVCFCNEGCGSKGYPCCKDRTSICSSTTILTYDDLT